MRCASIVSCGTSSVVSSKPSGRKGIGANPRTYARTRPGGYSLVYEKPESDCPGGICAAGGPLGLDPYCSGKVAKKRTPAIARFPVGAVASTSHPGAARGWPVASGKLSPISKIGCWELASLAIVYRYVN